MNNYTDINRITKKQYMDHPDIISFIIPYGVTSVEEYAFAQCVSLSCVAIPDTVNVLAVNAFYECESLERAYVYSEETSADRYTSGNISKKDDALARLLAITLRELRDSVLFDISKVGQTDWIKAFDTAFEAYLLSPDDKGFMPFLAGGEEDYESETSTRAHHLSGVRTKKAACLIDRLLAEEFFFIDAKLKTRYLDRLKSLCETGAKEGLSALASRKDNLEKTVELFSANGLLTDASVSELISTLPSEAVELKSLLMRIKSSDIFDTLTLN